MKRQIILLTLMMLGLCASAGAQTEANWIGKYEAGASGMNASGTRSYSSFYELEIMREDGGLTGLYRAGENGDVHESLVLDVELRGATAFFRYRHCLAPDETEPPCRETARAGELMFKLVRGTPRGRKPTLLTYGVKNDLLPRGEVFFVKLE